MAEAERETEPSQPGLVPLSTEPLAERLDRLERSVAGLQPAEAIEQQVAARVLAQLQSTYVANGRPPEGLAAGDASGVGGLVTAAVLRTVLPAAPAVGGGVWDRVGILRELRLMYHMYVDPRYRLSRVGQFGVPFVVALMVLNYFTVGGIPVVGSVLEDVVLVILSVALYKLLARDAARYQDVLTYLARYGG